MVFLWLSIPSLGKQSPQHPWGPPIQLPPYSWIPRCPGRKWCPPGHVPPEAWLSCFVGETTTPENPKKPSRFETSASFHRKITCWTMRTMISIVMWSLSADFGSLKQFSPLDSCQNRHHGESKRSSTKKSWVLMIPTFIHRIKIYQI